MPTAITETEAQKFQACHNFLPLVPERRQLPVQRLKTPANRVRQKLGTEKYNLVVQMWFLLVKF